MTIKSFKQVKLSELPLQRLQDNVRATLNAITGREILDGILIKDIQLNAGATNEINHKLDRSVIGWIVVRKRSDSNVWDMQDVNVNVTTTLSLACSSDVVIDLWIF